MPTCDEAEFTRIKNLATALTLDVAFDCAATAQTHDDHMLGIRTLREIKWGWYSVLINLEDVSPRR